jgi:hypothetical protein
MTDGKPIQKAITSKTMPIAEVYNTYSDEALIAETLPQRGVSMKQKPKPSQAPQNGEHNHIPQSLAKALCEAFYRQGYRGYELTLITLAGGVYASKKVGNKEAEEYFLNRMEEVANEK